MGARRKARRIWQGCQRRSAFCSCFDSSKARQTVRQGRFCPSGRGLIQERSQRGGCRACQTHPDAGRLIASVSWRPGHSLPFLQRGLRPVRLPQGAASGQDGRLAAFFRSCFDSSKARRTVRQGRFRGLLLVPVFAVKPWALPAPTADFGRALMACLMPHQMAWRAGAGLAVFPPG